MQESIEAQIKAAFLASPSLSGEIEGKRKIRLGKHGSRSSLFFSQKNQASIRVESRLEKLYCYALEAEPMVVAYRTQMLQIPYLGGSIFPDFLILNNDGVVFVREIKVSAFLSTTRNTQQIEWTKVFLSKHGIDFSVITEKDMWSKREGENRRLLYDRGARFSVPPIAIRMVVETISEMTSRQCTIEEAREEIKKRDLPVHALEAALFYGKVDFDQSKNLAPDTKIWVPV